MFGCYSTHTRQEDIMAFIETVPPGKATGETAQAYRLLENVLGSKVVPNIVQVFSLRPNSMRRMIRLWELSMWFGDVPRQTSEMIAAMVSRVNECHY